MFQIFAIWCATELHVLVGVPHTTAVGLPSSMVSMVFAAYTPDSVHKSYGPVQSMCSPVAFRKLKQTRSSSMRKMTSSHWDSPRYQRYQKITVSEISTVSKDERYRRYQRYQKTNGIGDINGIKRWMVSKISTVSKDQWYRRYQRYQKMNGIEVLYIYQKYCDTTKDHYQTFESIATLQYIEYQTSTSMKQEGYIIWAVDILEIGELCPLYPSKHNALLLNITPAVLLVTCVLLLVDLQTLPSIHRSQLYKRPQTT